MKIIIPMAGEGKRFLRDGYTTIKPLIKIGDKPMIAHACSAFPKGSKFIFICNKNHLDTTPLRSELAKIDPEAQILSIQPHNKGPVQSVLLAADLIPDDEEVIVNYCDFTLEWDYPKFLDAMHLKKADGGLAVFKGFQPAQFTGTKYAYVRVGPDLCVSEIQEKQSYTENKFEEFASTGTHYFRTGGLMKKYFKKAVEENLLVNGEFYASLPFNPFIKDGHKIIAFEVRKFICFGTPNDVRDYVFWYEYFSDDFWKEIKHDNRKT